MRGQQEFPLIEISGTAFERGLQCGEMLKDHIGHFVEYLWADLNESKIASGRVVEYVKKYIPYIEEYSPETSDEMKGMAAGSGRKYEEFVMISMNEEIESFSTLRSACTAFAATGRATVTGKAFLGQTWDEPSIDFPDNAPPHLIRYRRETGPDFLAWTYPGMIACAGTNSNGVSISWNTVPRLSLKVGVPTYVIVAEVLRQETIGSAISAIVNADRAGCFNFVISDETEIYNIEATPTDVDIHYSSTFIGRANHFISAKHKERQDFSKIGGTSNASSIIRYNRINRLLEESCGEIDLERCQGFFRDHVNYPYSICVHPDPAKKEKAITYSSWVIVPCEREMWVAHGPACENEFRRYLIAKESGLKNKQSSGFGGPEGPAGGG